jgi:hypothetical protein
MADKDSSDKTDSDTKASAGKSLNEQNWPGLLAITAFNLVVFAVVTATEPRWFSDLAAAWAFLLPAGIGLAMIRVVNGLINAKNKDRLVFLTLRHPWLTWHHPLPGSRAFSVHARNDDRFTKTDVDNKLRTLGVVPETLKKNPHAQNVCWYRSVFLPVQEKPGVQQAARNFLFARDYTAISFVMLIALGIASSQVIVKWPLYCGGLLLQYLLVRWAARNYGIEQVKNALAAWVSAPVTVKTDTAPQGSPTFLFIEVDEQGR